MKGNKINWFDFLGIRVNLSNNREFKSFEEARKFVKTLNLKSGLEWRAYCKSDKKPEEIPYSPETTYKKEWKGWGDWLGTGRIANQDKTFKSFEEARKFVKTLNLKNVKEWFAYCKSSSKPKYIPYHPEGIYDEWVNWGDWLGTGNTRNKDFKSFEKAKKFVQNLKLKNCSEWFIYCKSGSKPKDIPSNPKEKYKSEWKGYKDWLGTKK